MGSLLPAVDLIGWERYLGVRTRSAGINYLGRKGPRGNRAPLGLAESLAGLAELELRPLVLFLIAA